MRRLPKDISDLSKLHWMKMRKALLMSFAPQRFVSHASPSAALVRSFPDVLQYLAYLLKNGDDRQRSWAAAVDAKDLKMWLVLAGVADMLAILHKANLRTQRQSLRILEVDKNLATVKAWTSAWRRGGARWPQGSGC